MKDDRLPRFILIDTRARDCMRELGFDYEIYLPPPQGTITIADTATFRTEHGYGLVDGDPAHSYSPAGAAPYDFAACTEQAASALAYAGTRLGRRLGSYRWLLPVAGAEVYGSLSTGQPEFSGLSAVLSERLDVDDRYVQAVADWSRCMASSGLTYSDPAAVKNDLTRQYMELSQTPESRDGFRRREIVLAVADYQCYVNNISTVATIVETEIMTEMIDQGLLPTDSFSS